MNRIHEIKNKILENKYLDKAKNWFLKFFENDLYIVLLFIVAIINWQFKLVWLIFGFGILCILLIYFFRIPKEKLIPIAVASIISLRLEEDINYLIPVIISSFIIIILLIYDLLRKPAIAKNEILIGFILIFIAQIFSLINTPVLKTSLRAVFMWGFYILLFLYLLNLDFSDNNLGRYYIARVFAYLSIAIFIEILLNYFENGLNTNIIDFYGSQVINFGWADSSQIAMVYLIILPILLYFYTLNQKKYHTLIVAVLDIFMLHLMLSRGAYLAMVLLLIPLIIKTINDVKHKTKFIITIIYSSIVVLLILILVAIPTGLIKEFFDFLGQKGLSQEERQLIARIGFNVFKRFPLFGGGINSSEYYLSIAITKRYYDNFIIQTLADIGIIGFIAFGYFVFQLFRHAIIRNKYNSYVLLSLIALTIQGLIDTTFYNPIVMILFTIIFPLLATSEDEIEYMKGD